MLLRPAVMLYRITELTAQMVAEWNISALILDVDNTLTTHNNPVPHQEVLAWLEEMKQAGIRLVLVSNNRESRVLPFAESLGLGYTANAMKPLPGGFRRTARKLGLRPRQIGVVGDQIFTDILGGNLFGAKTILVEPMEAEDGPFFRLKRWLERKILRNNPKREKRI